jgi:hypothetical protein
MMMAEDLIISKFDKYWDDFAPFISEIIQVCFPSGKLIPNSLTHLKMLEILTRAQQFVHNDKPISGIFNRTKQPQLETTFGVPLAKKGRHATSNKKL